jgi:hypothetical protein
MKSFKQTKPLLWKPPNLRSFKGIPVREGTELLQDIRYPPSFSPSVLTEGQEDSEQEEHLHLRKKNKGHGREPRPIHFPGIPPRFAFRKKALWAGIFFLLRNWFTN